MLKTLLAARRGKSSTTQGYNAPRDALPWK
jgi:hypothetical protein